MKTLLILISFITLPAFADDGGLWLCEQTASERSVDTIIACGEGSGLDESQARRNALRAAVQEFVDICSISSDCEGRKRKVEPKRTSCKRDPRGFIECFRMIVVTLGK